MREHAVVHRIVEQHTTSHGTTPAIVDGRNVITYRLLNLRANMVARHLMAQGFHRGGHVVVQMPKSADLAIVLLAVLKAGGAYTWAPPAADAEGQLQAAFASRVEEDWRDYRCLALAGVLQQAVHPGPNLPILTRPTDIACVLGPADRTRVVLVSHATIAALRPEAPAVRPWQGEPATFDLWIGLMAGATLTVDAAPALLNAA